MVVSKGARSRSLNVVSQDLGILLSNASWRDVVDIAVVSVLIYQLLRLIQGTQAVQLLLGLVFLFVVAFAAQQFHLRLLEFIFANGSQAIVIAVIVLFQPELRRALDKVGRLGTLGPLLHAQGAPQRKVLEEVQKAAMAMAAVRHGALIVLERDSGLEELAGTGVRLNADLAADLIESVFYPGSPLHDGALIIRGGRVLAAGCVLPLAEEGTKLGRLGTRHRAAVGLSQACDALVVVVSEESGIVSVAMDGKLKRNLDAGGLGTVLRSGLGLVPSGGRPSVRSFLPRTSGPRQASRHRSERGQ